VNTEITVMKVSSKSRSTAVAGAIAGMFRNEEADEIDVLAIGAGAVYQAVKAVCHARRFLDEDGEIEFACEASFVDQEIDGEERTAVRLHLYPRI
jgi:stage V sporulation protein S